MARFNARGLPLAGAIVLIDQVTKALVPGAHLAHLTTLHNSGLILGAFRGPAPILAVGTIVVMLAFFLVVGRVAVEIGVPAALPALVVGGMAGNALDRLRFGHVRDFLPTPVAIVNLADVAVVTGLVALVVAFAVRVWRLRRTGQTIAIDFRAPRAVSVAPVGVPETQI